MSTHLDDPSHTPMDLHFTTRCPACGTLFRVTEDQLKISDGWVRCGHCADVFDAKLYLSPWPEPIAPDPAADAPFFPVRPDGTADPTRSGSGANPRTVTPRWVAESQQNRTANPEAQPERRRPTADEEPAETAASIPMPLSSRWDADADTDADVPTPWLQRWRRADTGRNEPSFVRQARRRAFWHTPGMRLLLSVLALLLTVALGLQVLLHQRDHIAAWQPSWTPALQKLCVPLGCDVAALRRIDAIVIDSSTLLRRANNQYALDVVLQNTAPVPLALPALELSLTDSRDAVIARRVFLPHELPGAPAQLPASSTVTLKLSLALAVGESMPMAGYRALVFYP